MSGELVTNSYYVLQIERYIRPHVSEVRNNGTGGLGDVHVDVGRPLSRRAYEPPEGEVYNPPHRN